MKEWWQQLNVREQRLVVVMGSVVSLFVLYSFIWQPLNENIDKSEGKLARQQSLLTWVEANISLFEQAKQSGGNQKNSGSIASIVNRSAGRNNITIARIQPQGEDLQVWVDKVPFDQLLNWLEHLANKEGLVVRNIDLSKSDQKGVVSVKRLQLGRN
jgi:general secretion pathway protein M